MTGGVDMLDLVFRVEELERRLARMILPARVVSVDATAARLKAEAGSLRTGWLPWLAPRAGNDAAWHAPEPGEQVLLIAPSGELARAVAIPAIYQDAHPAPERNPDVRRMRFADGATIAYDRAAHRLEAILPAGGAAHLVAPGGLVVDGPMTLNGDLAHNGSQTVSGDVVASGISLTRHVHGGVTPGMGNTGGPQ